MHKLKREQGFTLIELLVIIIIVGILLTLVGMTYSGVQAKNRNERRKVDINNLKASLETYYASINGVSKYPTLAELNDADFRTKNLKDFKDGSLSDPRWNTKITVCTKDGKVQIVAAPMADCYAYQVTASDGSICDNTSKMCAQYTLTALLEGGEKYVKSSLN